MPGTFGSVQIDYNTLQQQLKNTISFHSEMRCIRNLKFCNQFALNQGFPGMQVVHDAPIKAGETNFICPDV